jgi:hypothetical protein
MKQELCEHPIQVKQSTLDRLKKLKLARGEALNDVIERLLKNEE